MLKKVKIPKIILEILSAILLCILIELAFNYQALIGGYKPVEISESTVTEKGKLIYQKSLNDPVFIKKLIILGTVERRTPYRVEVLTVNDFGKEETQELEDTMYSEFDSAFTNINAKVKEIKVTIGHASRVHIDGISYSNEFKWNKYRMFFFFVVSLLGIWILFERKIILEKTWLFYLIASLGFGSIMALSTGTCAVTWDEEVHYATVYNTSFLGESSYNSAVISNFSRNGWNEINTQEELTMLKRYLNRLSEEEADPYIYAKSWKVYITHFPMILAYHLGEKLGLSYTDNFILGRFGNLIFCILLNTIAIYLARRKKLLIAIVGMMPTVIFQNSMYTYDGVSFSCITLGVVLCMNEIEKIPQAKFDSSSNLLASHCGIFYTNSVAATGNLILSGAFMLAGCIAKPTYLPITLLLVPCIKERIKPLLSSRKRKQICAGVFGVTAVLFVCVVIIKLQPLWSSITSGDMLYGGDARGGDTGMAGQILSMINHPFATIKMFVRDIFSFDNFRNTGDEIENTVLICNQMFANLYQLGTLKEVWALVLLPLMLLLFFVEPQGEILYRGKMKKIRFYCLGAVLLSVILVWLAMYLTFTPIGDGSIKGVQARYFLPLFLPFAYAVSNSKITLNISRLRYYQVALGSALLVCGECIYKFIIVGKVL